jgi:lysyl-tRNA synthetase class 2
MSESIEIDGVVTPTFDIVDRYFDIGDFIGISGTAFKNQRGFPTVSAEAIQLLSKSISPMPEKHH